MKRNRILSNAHSENVLKIARRTARSYGATKEEADDVAQETAMNFTKRWNADMGLKESQKRGPAAWDNYVARSARNAHIDCIRKNARRQLRERNAVAADGLASAQLAGGVDATNPSGIERYLARLAVLEASELLDSERQRDVIRLTFNDGLSADEVGLVLEIEAQTARLHLRNAVDALRPALEEGLI